MNIREALEKGAFKPPETPHPFWDTVLLDRLAPKVEAALRAAHEKGFSDALGGKFDDNDRGVTAGVEKLADG